MPAVSPLDRFFTPVKEDEEDDPLARFFSSVRDTVDPLDQFFAPSLDQQRAERAPMERVLADAQAQREEREARNQRTGEPFDPQFAKLSPYFPPSTPDDLVSLSRPPVSTTATQDIPDFARGPDTIGARTTADEPPTIRAQPDEEEDDDFMRSAAEWISPVTPEDVGGLGAVAQNLGVDKVVGGVVGAFAQAGKSIIDLLTAASPGTVPNPALLAEKSREVLEHAKGFVEFGPQQLKNASIMAGLGPDGWNPLVEIVKRKLAGDPMRMDELREKYPAFAAAGEELVAFPAGPAMALSMAKHMLVKPTGLQADIAKATKPAAPQRGAQESLPGPAEKAPLTGGGDSPPSIPQVRKLDDIRRETKTLEERIKRHEDKSPADKPPTDIDALYERRATLHAEELGAIRNEAQKVAERLNVPSGLMDGILARVYDVDPGAPQSPVNFFDLQKRMIRNPDRIRKGLRDKIESEIFGYQKSPGAATLRERDAIGPDVAPLQPQINRLATRIENDLAAMLSRKSEFVEQPLSVTRDPASRGLGLPESAQSTKPLKPVIRTEQTPAGDQVTFAGQRQVPTTPIRNVGKKVKAEPTQGDVFQPDKIAPGNLQQDQGGLFAKSPNPSKKLTGKMPKGITDTRELDWISKRDWDDLGPHQRRKHPPVFELGADEAHAMGARGVKTTDYAEVGMGRGEEGYGFYRRSELTAKEELFGEQNFERAARDEALAKAKIHGPRDEATEFPFGNAVELGALGTPEAYRLLGKSVVSSAKTAMDVTTDLAKRVYGDLAPPAEKGIVKALSGMREHHKAIRDGDFVAVRMKRVGSEAMKKAEIEDGMNIIHAMQQPGKYLDKLSTNERLIFDWINAEAEKVRAFVKKHKLAGEADLPAGTEYLFQWWKNPDTGKPFNPFYGKFSRTMPQARSRAVTKDGEMKFPTYEAGQAAGLEPATTNPGELVGLMWKSATRAHETQRMIKTLKRIDSHTEGSIMMRGGKERPMRLVEDWNYLENHAPTEDYIRFDHRAFKKPIGVHKDLEPWVTAYFDNPTYGKAMQLAFTAKAIKLSLSLFHPKALMWQAMAAGQNPLKVVSRGNRLIREGDDTMKILHRNGLETHGYADVGITEHGEILRFQNKALSAVAAPLRVTTNWIFNTLHPGMKAAHAHQKYNALLPEYIKKYGDSPKTRDRAARDVVKMGDKLFSGEDYKLTMLESGRFMAKAWYSPGARKAWQAGLISPTWQKAHIGMAAKVGQSFIPDALLKKMGFEGKAPISKEYRLYLARAMAIYAAANVANWVATKEMDGEGRMLFQNPEDRKFHVRLPYNEPDGRGAYIYPLKSLFEVPGLVADFGQKTIYKLAPYWMATASQAFNFDYRGKRYDEDEESFLSSPKRWADWVIDAAAPISVAQSGVLDRFKDEDKRPKSKTVASRVLGSVGFPVSRGDYVDPQRQLIVEVGKDVRKFLKGKGHTPPSGGYGTGPHTTARRKLFDALVAKDTAEQDRLLTEDAEKEFKERAFKAGDFADYIENRNPFLNLPKQSGAYREFMGPGGGERWEDKQRIVAYLNLIKQRASKARQRR